MQYYVSKETQQVTVARIIISVQYVTSLLVSNRIQDPCAKPSRRPGWRRNDQVWLNHAKVFGSPSVAADLSTLGWVMQGDLGRHQEEGAS